MPTYRLAGILLCVVTTAFGQAPALQPTEKKPENVKLTPGDHSRTLTVGKLERKYLVHVPKSYDADKPTPVVLALHGAAMNGPLMVWYTGLNDKSDAEGFIVVYPSGTGTGPLLTWNAGGFAKKANDARPDDVAFLGKMLDELETLVNVDKRRVFACGMSNGGMMCYRLAAELSDRIAAIAPVAGTIAIAQSKPQRPVSVLHMHGTKDTLVPFAPRKKSSFMSFKGVEESVRIWVDLNACETKPTTDTLTKEGDPMQVVRRTYSGGKDGSEVALVIIEEGGHTWPGRQTPFGLMGKSVENIQANDLLWEFFEKHPMK